MKQPAIMVDCHKIISWMEERKKLKKNWFQLQKTAEEMIKVLIKDSQQLTGYPQIYEAIHINKNNFTYYDVATTVQLLLQTELANNRTILFGYGDKRVKEWTALKKYMQGKGVAIVNLGKFIDQALTFDLPALNKSIQMLDNQLNGLKRKVDFNRNTIFSQQQAIKKERAALEMPVESTANIEQEIPVMISQVPTQFQNIQTYAKETIDLQNYLDYYLRYCKKGGIERELQMLAYFLKNGDEFVAAYEGKQLHVEGEKYAAFYDWKPHNEWEIEIQGENDQHTESQGNKTLLEERTTRQKLLLNLNELLYFYKGLKYEQDCKMNRSIAVNNLEQLEMPTDDIVKAVNELQTLIERLTTPRLLRPIQLKNTKRSYQLFVSDFRNYELNIQNLESQIRDYEKQVEEVTMRRDQEAESLRSFRRKIVQNKQQCEKLLTELVQREIRITGEVNKLE